MTPSTLFLTAALCAAVVKACHHVARRTTYKHEAAEIALCFALMGAAAFVVAVVMCFNLESE